MKKLVFIDRGNIVRSQIAKALFNQNPTSGWKASAYGTMVQSENREGMKLSEWGNGMDILIDELKKHDIDISDQRCHQIIPDHLQDADRVIVMSELEDTPLWLQSLGYEHWEVENPPHITPAIAKSIVSVLPSKIENLKKSL